FDLDGVRQLMLNGIDACWQPEEIKAQWRQDWAREFDLLRQMLAQEPRIDTAHHIPYHRRYKV
ncbi:adenosine deaminase, partial [Salmonella enterica]|nr:adenosine deaminase [Salmonella enterica]